MPDARSYLNITGIVSQDQSDGYVRLFNNGPIENFIGAEISQLQPGSNIEVSQQGNAVVPILSRLAISNYPQLPPPILPVDPTHFGHAEAHLSPGPVRVPGYFLTDGSELTATEQDGLVVSLNGKSAGGDMCTLTATVRSWEGPGRETLGKAPGNVTWVTAALEILKGTNPPFIFNFSYSAQAFLFKTSTSQHNIANMIEIDLAPAVVEEQTGPDLIGTAILQRTLTYYGEIFSVQALEVPASTLDAQFHLANQATLWPFMADIALFSDVFENLGGPAPQLDTSAFVTIGSLNDFLPPPPLADLTDQLTTVIAPCLGPLAATCLSADDSVVSLKSATNWLTRLLIDSADGQSAIASMATAYRQSQLAQETNSENQPTMPVNVDPRPGPTEQDTSKPMPADENPAKQPDGT